jgi:hypothetical protein
LLGFNNFSSGNTAGADISPLNGPFEINLDSLEVRKESTESLADDFRTGTACPFDLTAPFVFDARNRAFLTYHACFCHNEFPKMLFADKKQNAF